jgi:general secretion pathway protein G
MLKGYVERTLEKRDEGGFTLIELLIVIIILAILAAIVVFAVGTTGSNAKYSACNSDAKTFETALESYKAQVGTYPASGVGSVLTSSTSIAGSTAGPFMRQLPSTSHYQIVTDGSGGVYILPPAPYAVPGGLGSSSTVSGTLTGNSNGVTYSTLTGTNADNTKLSFDASNGAICSDANVVQ